MTTKGTSLKRKNRVVGRMLMTFSISETTMAKIDKLGRLTGEARGRIVDAVIGHAGTCACAVCAAVASEKPG